MKRLLSVALMLCMVFSISSVTVNVFAAGGFISIGDSNNETLFTGSASSHNLLLSSNGVVSAWGDNTYGQCGAEPCDEITEINCIDFESKITKVAAGNDFSLALDENNVAWGWGNNRYFQLGLSRPTCTASPTQFSMPEKIAENIVDIAAGDDFSMLLNTNGEVLFSGMGNAQTLKKFDLPQVDGQTPKIKFIAASYNNAIAVGENAFVFHWKSDRQSARVVRFTDVDEIQSVAAGKEHIIIRCLNGENIEFYGLGDNSKSQLGTLNISEATEPTLVLSIPYEQNQHVAEFAGAYNTVVNVWNNLSVYDKMKEYRWGTFAAFQGDNSDATMADQVTIIEPEEELVDYQTVAVGNENNIGFNFITNEIMIYNDLRSPELIPIIEPFDSVETMYEYQYEDVDYHTYNVNFIKLDKDKFSDGNNDGEYLYWEYVNENQFRIKVKNFINGLGNSRFNPAISTIILSKELTGENRTVGTYGPSIWNFNPGNDVFETETTVVNHGNEDGTEMVVSAYVSGKTEKVPLLIPSDVDVFYENPGEITPDTKLGLYLYGLPEGTTGTITDISDNTFKITLSGNSVSDMDYDDVIKLSYIRTDENQIDGSVGDYNLNEVSVFAGKGKLSGFTIKSLANTPETLTVDGALEKGREDGKVINVSISGGTFADVLSVDAWEVIGAEEVGIKSIERVDDNSAKITLSGNSEDKYTSAELKIQCEGSQYSDSRVYDENTGNYIESDLLSENYVSLTKQSRSTGGSVSSTIAKPSSSVKSGEVVKGTKVELLSSINNSKIYYTTDGTQPTTQSCLYQEPIEISGDMTIKFIAVSGSGKSSIQTVTYTVKTTEIAFKENTFKYISGYDDNTFKPDQAIIRYEMLESLERLLDIEKVETDKLFPDVDKDKKDLVSLFSGAGIIDGFDDGTFRGDEGLTRAEFVKVMSIILNIEPEANEASFSDAADHWAESYIADFESLGYLKGYDDGTFRPDNKISRAEFVAVINRIIENNSEPANNKFSDVDDSHWAFEEISKAVSEK